MKILVDADACPVKEIVVKLAKEKSIAVMMFIDTSHELYDGYSEIITIGKGADAVDIALINKTQSGDIVVTQDYGVATLALAKKAKAINQDGRIYNDANIDGLLFQRFLSKKVRKGGGKTSNPKKRTKEDNLKFEESFRKLLEEKFV